MEEIRETLEEYKDCLSKSRYEWIKAFCDHPYKDKALVINGYLMALKEHGIYTGDLQQHIQMYIMEEDLREEREA